MKTQSKWILTKLALIVVTTSLSVPIYASSTIGQGSFRQGDQAIAEKSQPSEGSGDLNATIQKQLNQISSADNSGINGTDRSKKNSNKGGDSKGKKQINKHQKNQDTVEVLVKPHKTNKLGASKHQKAQLWKYLGG